MQRIIIEPQKLWSYIKQQDKNGQLDTTMYEIASNDEYGISVYISKDARGRYCIIVEADETEIFNEYVYNEEDARHTCDEVYENYLTDKVINIISDMENGDDEDEDYVFDMELEDEIETRENDLTEFTMNFIMDILGGDAYFDSDDFDEIIEDCKEHFLEYMARKHGLAIYRPMILEGDDGEDFFEEYPYECMEFDDEDNPIYQP